MKSFVKVINKILNIFIVITIVGPTPMLIVLFDDGIITIIKMVVMKV